jgi:hypothetical protein
MYSLRATKMFVFALLLRLPTPLLPCAYVLCLQLNAAVCAYAFCTRHIEARGKRQRCMVD